MNLACFSLFFLLALIFSSIYLLNSLWWIGFSRLVFIFISIDWLSTFLSEQLLSKFKLLTDNFKELFLLFGGFFGGIIILAVELWYKILLLVELSVLILIGFILNLILGNLFFSCIFSLFFPSICKE